MGNSGAPTRSGPGLLGFGGLLLPLLAADAAAGAMPAETAARVREATVQVVMGDKKAGSKKIGHKLPARSGSGCFITNTGLVITNNHVVDPTHGSRDPIAALQVRTEYNLLQYRIIVNGGTPQSRVHKARLIYQCESADLALLQAVDDQDQPLTPTQHLNIIPSGSIRSGQRVELFGFPGGNLMSTSSDQSAPVTTTRGNILSVPRRPGGRIPEIFTDVQAARGNSGGPLVNQEGEIVGIVATIGADMRAATMVNARVVPGDLVVDLVRVADHLNKLPPQTDVVAFKSHRRSDASHNAPGNDSLMDRLHISDRKLTTIAKRLDQGSTSGLDALIKDAVSRKAPKPLKEQAGALRAAYHVQSGAYDKALTEFKKLRRASIAAVREYALGRVFLLKQHPDGLYEGQPLSSRDTWNRAGRATSRAVIQEAREQLAAYAKSRPVDHRSWKRLARTMERLEDNLIAANSLDPGAAELDIFLLWRFRQNANLNEIGRLVKQTRDLERELEDFKKRPRPKNNQEVRRYNQHVDKVNGSLKRFQRDVTETIRAWEDTQDLLGSQGWAGFRIDDPAALSVLSR